MLAASAALLGTLPWLATRVVLPAMVRDRVGEELRAAGFPHAALHIERVTLGAVVLTDVQLDSTLHIERVQATLDWTRARVDAVEVEGLRWMVEASATGLRDNALARLLDRDGEHADGGVAPLLRLDDARVTLRHGDRRWSARVDGTMNPAARRGRLRLRHDERGPYELEVRFDQGAGATTLHTHLRSLERDDTARAHITLRDDGSVELDGSAELAPVERASGVHLGATRVHLRGSVREGRVGMLELRAFSERASAGELAIEHTRLDAARDGPEVRWSLRATTKDGLEAYAAGALPLELARWADSLEREGFLWELAGPVPAVFLERRVNGIAFDGDPRVALRGLAHRAHGGAWTVEDARGTVAMDGVHVPSANAQLEDVRAELAARGAAHDGTASVTLEDGSWLTAARGHLEEVHVTDLETRARLGILVDPRGVRIHAHEPLDVRTGQFAIGQSRAALRFEHATFTLRERAAPLAEMRPDRLHIGFVLHARAPRVRGVLRGRGVDASGALEVDVRGAQARIDLPLSVRARALAQPDSETALADARLDLPLRWRDRQLSARGQVEARALAWRDTTIGPTHGSVRLGRRMLELAWSAPATGHTAFRLDAEVALDGTGDGRVDVEMPASEVRAGDPAQRVLATLTDMRVEGRVEGEVHVELGAPGRGRARLRLAGASVDEVEGAGKGRGVEGTLRFRRLTPLVGASDAPVTWSELELGDVVRLGPGAATLRFVATTGGSEITVEGMHAAAAGGRLRLAPFRFDGEAPAMDLDVEVEGIALGPLVRVLSEGRASATGHVDGRVRFRVQLGDRRRVVLGRGRLAARGPGRFQVGDGRLDTLDERRLATLIEGEWIQRRVLAALADFEYRELVLDLEPHGGTTRVRAHVLGRGRRLQQELDLSLNVRGVQPLLDHALHLWPRGTTATMEARSS